MSNVLRAGKVYIQNVFAGKIKETDAGYEFEYDSEYMKKEDAKAVSITLPLSTKKYESKFLFPFFDGLIPEGWLLEITVENWKLNRQDRFGLMLISCKDCIGDVHIVVENEG